MVIPVIVGILLLIIITFFNAAKIEKTIGKCTARGA